MKITASFLHMLATSGFIGLFALLLFWNTLFVPVSKLTTYLPFLVYVTPLLLPVRGFLRGNLKSCAWMAYASLIYLIHGSNEAFVMESTRLLALLEVGLSLLLFFGSTFYIRQSKSLNARTITDSV